MKKQKGKGQRKKEVGTMEMDLAKESELNNEVSDLYNDVYSIRDGASLRKKILEGLH